MMTSYQAEARASLIRKEQAAGNATQDELDWLWQYENGFILTSD